MPNIPIEKDQLWFRSPLFDIAPGEDAETNPFCYGKALAKWLAAALSGEGIEVDDVFAEDWGWCVMVKRKPFRLWVGCGNVHNSERQGPDISLPRGEDVIWTCIVVAEVPLLKRLFHAPSAAHDQNELFGRINRIVAAARGTIFVSEP